MNQSINTSIDQSNLGEHLQEPLVEVLVPSRSRGSCSARTVRARIVEATEDEIGDGDGLHLLVHDPEDGVGLHGDEADGQKNG